MRADCFPMEQLEMMELWSSVDEVVKHLGVAQDSILPKNDY